MRTERITFRLSDKEYIFIELPCLEQEIDPYVEVIATFKTADNKEYDLDDFYLAGILHDLNRVLTEILKENLSLHKSIDENIGLLWNEDLQKKRDLPYRIGSEGGKFWVGLDHNLWSSMRDCRTRCDTWMYQKNNKIFLEITPVYDLKPGDKYITYDEFIKNYKPYVVREIPRDTARRWLTKTEELLKLIQDNYELYKQQAEQENYTKK